MKLHRAPVTSVAVLMIILHAVISGASSRAQLFDEPIKVIAAVAPIFPPVVVASNTSGSVVMEVKIDPAGEVTSVNIVDGHPLLRRIKSLESTARRWRFTPEAGDKVLRTVRLTFTFRIVPKGTPADELTPVFMPPYQVEVRHPPLEPIVH